MGPLAVFADVVETSADFVETVFEHHGKVLSGDARTESLPTRLRPGRRVEGGGIDELGATRMLVVDALQCREPHGLDQWVRTTPEERNEAFAGGGVGVRLGVECGECEARY